MVPRLRACWTTSAPPTNHCDHSLSARGHAGTSPVGNLARPVPEGPWCCRSGEQGPVVLVFGEGALRQPGSRLWLSQAQIWLNRAGRRRHAPPEADRGKLGVYSPANGITFDCGVVREMGKSPWPRTYISHKKT